MNSPLSKFTSSAVFPGLIIENDVGIKVRDGTVLRANVFRPSSGGPVPVIITLGPYPKDMHFSQWVAHFAPQLVDELAERGPYLHWETVNPEWWVPHGYAVVRIDARGTGKSPGKAALQSKAETLDLYDGVEWAGAQPWSNGRVAVMGISYFAIGAWRVAALRPPSLAAIVAWEGAADAYRDIHRHGGIYSNEFAERWSARARPDGEPGPLPPEEFGPFYADQNPDLAAIEVPVLSAGNWSGAALHLRGNIYGFLGAGSRHKHLRVHLGDHVKPFYALDGRLEQLRFLEQYVKGVASDLDREPPVKLAIRRGGHEFRWRYEEEWPIARTQWTPYYLDAVHLSLATAQPAAQGVAGYLAEPDQDGALVRFSTAPLAGETEITGPLALHAWISIADTDADLFATLRAFGPDGKEVTFEGVFPGTGPQAVAHGWLRASHRRLDEPASTPWQPVHDHREPTPLVPGEIVRVDIELWPTSVALPAGSRLVLELGANDDPGMAPFRHTDARDRRWGKHVQVYTGAQYPSHLLLPLVPRR